MEGSKKLMDINQMKRSDFLKLRHAEEGENIGMFDSLVILPLARCHDSGYRCMDFVAVRGQEPICLLSGCTSVVFINGIGGYGWNWQNRNDFFLHVAPAGWRLDCLPQSGLLRLFCRGKLRVRLTVSTFEIYCMEVEKEVNNVEQTRTRENKANAIG